MTWLMKIKAISLQLARTRVSMTPDTPKSQKRRRKKIKRTRVREKKRLGTVLYCGLKTTKNQ